MDDDGFSLAEVLMSTAIMAITTAITITGFYGMYQTTDRAEAAADAQNDLQTAFNRLDREVRYASRVGDPYVYKGAWAVDFVFSDASGVYQCVQLSLPQSGGTMLRRQWPQSPPATSLLTASTPATAVANDLTNGRNRDAAGAAVNPFQLIAAGSDDSQMDRLDLRIVSTSGVGPGKSSTRLYDVQFTAQNTVKRATDALSCGKS
jgi:prepilin-type N-terminal cleavage/methylation domain-containing protein